MTKFEPERLTARFRTVTVAAVTSPTVTLSIDGVDIAGVPVYGPMPTAGQGALAIDQGGSLLVIGSAVSLVERIEALEARLDAIERK